MTAALFALRTNQQPAIVQVNEVATATMMAAKGAVYPVHPADGASSGVPFDPASYMPAVAGYYTDVAGNMLSLPFNASTPILYYNKDQFRLAKLDPEQPPRDLDARSRRRPNACSQAAGVPCGFTTAWPSWVHIENFSAVHNIPIATQQNGFGGLNTELTTSTIPRCCSTSRRSPTGRRRQDLRLRRPGRPGRRQVPRQPVRHLHHVPRRARPDILANAKFEVGYGEMPYWPDLVGGAAQRNHRRRDAVGAQAAAPRPNTRAWRSSSRSCRKPEIQACWHQTSGYLPITRAAYELSQRQGFYDRNPGTDISIRQITRKAPTENTKGLRLGSFVLMREVIEDELEQAISGKTGAQGGTRFRSAARKRDSAAVRAGESVGPLGSSSRPPERREPVSPTRRRGARLNGWPGTRASRSSHGHARP